MSGFMASARTIATRCCWPPDNRSGISSRLSARPKRANTSVASASAVARESLRTRRGASVTLSSTDMCGNRLKAWKTIPTRRRIRSTATPSAVISSPTTTIRPASIGSSRLMQRRSVDLPEPDAPIRQTTSCSATVRSMPRRTCSDPNDLCNPSMRKASAGATLTWRHLDRSADRARHGAPCRAR